MQMQPEIRNAVALPDIEYTELKMRAKGKGKRGYTCWDKKGERHRFYMVGDVLHGEHIVNDKLETYEVMSMSEAMNKKKEMEENNPNPFKDYIKEKMRADNPDLPDEHVEANADIVVEANETIKRLISAGVDIDVAHKLIKGVLESEEAQERIIQALDERKRAEEQEAKVAELDEEVGN